MVNGKISKSKMCRVVGATEIIILERVTINVFITLIVTQDLGRKIHEKFHQSNINLVFKYSVSLKFEFNLDEMK